MPRPTATMRSAWPRSTAWRASWNGGSTVWRDGARRAPRSSALTAAGAPPGDGVGAERADLAGDDGRAVALRRHLGHELALEHRPQERGARAAALHAHDVGHERRAQARRQARRVVPRLVGVRHDHEPRRRLARSRRPRPPPARRAYTTPARRPRRSATSPTPASASCRAASPPPGSQHRDRLAGRELLRAGHGLPAGAVERARALLGHDENHRALAVTGRAPRRAGGARAPPRPGPAGRRSSPSASTSTAATARRS